MLQTHTAAPNMPEPMALGGAVGNNQIANAKPQGTLGSPNFFLAEAMTVYAGRRMVLIVKGNFVNPTDVNCNPIAAFEGLFVAGPPVDKSGSKQVYDLTLKAPPNRMKPEHQQAFIGTVRSIQWC